MAQTITLTISKKEILWDIYNDSHIIAQGLFVNGTTSEAAYNIQADEEDVNKNKLLRSIQLAVGSLKPHLVMFLSDSATTITDNNNLSDDNSITLTLSVSSRFNTAMTPAISTLCHKYIMNQTLFDWFNATKKDIAADYLTLAQTAINEIKGLFAKKAPSRADIIG